jgi:hypothetical protein
MLIREIIKSLPDCNRIGLVSLETGMVEKSLRPQHKTNPVIQSASRDYLTSCHGLQNVEGKEMFSNMQWIMIGFCHFLQTHYSHFTKQIS